MMGMGVAEDDVQLPLLPSPFSSRPTAWAGATMKKMHARVHEASSRINWLPFEGDAAIQFTIPVVRRRWAVRR